MKDEDKTFENERQHMNEPIEDRGPLDLTLLTEQYREDLNKYKEREGLHIQTENQLKIALLASYIFEFNERNSLYVANNSGYLNSASFLQNEIYRIGGEKSIRGFNTQSLFATEYSFFNVAYRFLASKKSLVYTITDFGKFKGLNTSKKALSIGAGYQFLTNNSQVNLSYALGRIDNQPFDYKTPTLNINFVTYF